MAKPSHIDLPNGLRIPILHEDRNVIAIDKPAGWMLAPITWQSTGRNLFAALTSSMNGGDFWAKSRNLKFLRFVHRLDADTSGVVLFVKTPGAMPAYTELFEERRVRKTYLAVVHGVPEIKEWRCELRLAPVPDQPGRMEVNDRLGKDAETFFRVVATRGDRALVLCWPRTGRTHQIRVHLAAVGHPVRGDELYGPVPAVTGQKTDSALALRAIGLSYEDPFQAIPVQIKADFTEFVRAAGFDPAEAALQEPVAPATAPEHPKGRRSAPSRRTREEKFPRREERPHGARSRPGRDWSETEMGEDDFAPPEVAARPRRGGRGGGRFAERRPFQRRPGSGRPFDRPPHPGGQFRGGPRPADWKERGPRPYRARPSGARDERRPDFPREETRAPRGGGPRGRSEGDFREPSRPGVFRSSARPGLRASFQSGRENVRPAERPFRPERPGARASGKLGGSKPYGIKPLGGGKPFGGKPAWQRQPARRPFQKFSGPR